MTTRRAALIASLAFVALRPGVAAAGTCSVTTISPVVFGAYDRFAPSPTDATGSITIECSDVGVADAVRIDLGPGAANGFGPRTLVNGALMLAYNLYRDASHLSVWGDGTGGTATYGPVHPSEGSTSISIYGRMPAGQSQPAGVYGDTLTVTLQF
jgi:spore coat protein U-like protein